MGEIRNRIVNGPEMEEGDRAVYEWFCGNLIPRDELEPHQDFYIPQSECDAQIAAAIELDRRQRAK